MIFAQEQKLPTLNGYSGNAPPNYIPPFPCTSPAARVHALSSSVFARAAVRPEEILSRTQWIPLERCPKQVRRDRCGAGATRRRPGKEHQARCHGAAGSPEELHVLLRIRNNGSSTLHTVSRVGHPLRVTWRFVPSPPSADLANPPWIARYDAYLSIPPGGEEELPLIVRMPSDPGPHECTVFDRRRGP